MSRHQEKKFTTKQLYIPAKGVLNHLANNRQTKYPIEIAMKNPAGGITWMVNNREELLGDDTQRKLGNSNLTYIRAGEDSTHVEFKKKGKITVSVRLCPEIEHGTVLTEMETQKICRILLQNRQQ